MCQTFQRRGFTQVERKAFLCPAKSRCRSRCDELFLWSTFSVLSPGFYWTRDRIRGPARVCVCVCVCVCACACACVCLVGLCSGGWVVGLLMSLVNGSVCLGIYAALWVQCVRPCSYVICTLSTDCTQQFRPLSFTGVLWLGLPHSGVS